MKKTDWKEEYMRIGDRVKVKEGTICPDSKTLNIGGWKGGITEITEDEHDNVLICIAWDVDTIKMMPKQFIDQGNLEGLDNDLMYLYPEDIEIIKL